MALAHARQDAESGQWSEHSLVEHALGVSELAAGFASSFDCAEWGRACGLLHDLGKFNPAWQAYLKAASGYDPGAHLETQPGKPNHSSAGAIHAVGSMGPSGRILAYIIAGHHAGLPDWMGGQGGLEARLQDQGHLKWALGGHPWAELGTPALPIERPPITQAEDAHLWIRMLFSCLVDADFLDTEAFMDPGRSAQRAPESLGLSALKDRLDQHVADLAARAEPTEVNRIRREVLASCRMGAALDPGLFSLTVPTGGGKTLASMAFALDHARLKNKRRIIVVIPYTSIIEQTAETLAGIFGPGAVLEHHSNLDPEKETRQSRLATENWDAPIVVTTNVQFFESLFAARTSACRKLHNLVDSVVIFDEAQMLPSPFLKPILHVLGSLVRHYGVSAVLCTATQPALRGRIGTQKAVFDGLAGVRELMADPAGLAVGLRRTQLRLHAPDLAPITWEALAEELSRFDQVLCIVSTRTACRALHRLMPEGTIHLSALMCPQHRSEVIQDIKTRLKDGLPIRVISTQLVEAGVDLDFPTVYRALAGLDSMAQAAGRCNREGRLGRLGEVVLFVPPQPSRSGLLRKGEDASKEMLRACPEVALSLDPGAFDRYFQLFYGKVSSFDEKGIHDLLVRYADRGQFQFREAAQAFHLIEDEDQQAIIVRYGPHRQRLDRLVADLRHAGPNRDRMRSLQRFSVTLPGRMAKALLDQGDIEEIQGLWVQAVDGLYDDRTGLSVDFVRFNPELYAP